MFEFIDFHFGYLGFRYNQSFKSHTKLLNDSICRSLKRSTMQKISLQFQKTILEQIKTCSILNYRLVLKSISCAMVRKLLKKSTKKKNQNQTVPNSFTTLTSLNYFQKRDYLTFTCTLTAAARQHLRVVGYTYMQQMQRRRNFIISRRGYSFTIYAKNFSRCSSSTRQQNLVFCARSL